MEFMLLNMKEERRTYATIKFFSRTKRNGTNCITIANWLCFDSF